jgi:hypothetical protein
MESACHVEKEQTTEVRQRRVQWPLEPRFEGRCDSSGKPGLMKDPLQLLVKEPVASAYLTQ